MQWTETAGHYVSLVAAGNLQPEIVTVFWLRAYGVLYDVREHLRGLRETFVNAAPALLQKFGLDQSALVPINDLLSSLDRMRGVFNEDEQAYFEFRRHVECHPLQHAYTLQVKGGTIKTRKSRFSGREWTYEEEDEALRRVIRLHSSKWPAGPDEPAIARDFAQRLLPMFSSFKKAMEDFFGQATWLPPP
jgi:hypothetical protein